MSETTAKNRVLLPLLLAAACVCGATPTASAQAPRTEVPDFSGSWLRFPNRQFAPPPSGPGPVTDPRGPRKGNQPDFGDISSPILKPHAAAAIKARNELVLADKTALPPWSVCWPAGVPLVLNLGEPVQFLQTAEQVTILYERDMQVRRIYMNARHPAALKPSWYGHSVGHYEGVNGLVVDTVGLSTQSSVDRFGTPHSEKLHVVERYTLKPDGKTLAVDFTVEDPDTFTTAWSAHAEYLHEIEVHKISLVEGQIGRPAQRPVHLIGGPVNENVCAENNRDVTTGRDYDIPVAGKADF